MKRDNKGFTMVEMMVVVAMVAIMASTAMPKFDGILEKSRETTDLANARTAYMQIMMDACLGENPKPIRVPLKQKKAGWQSAKVLRVADQVYTAGSGAYTDNWQGEPEGNGICVVSYSFQKGILFNWRGYPFNTQEKLFDALESTELLNGYLKNISNFEIDSKCPNSSMVPLVKKNLKNNSLLDLGTWAYLGNGNPNSKDRYLYWTSVDTNQVGAGKEVPVIIQTSDGRFFISTTTTGQRQKDNGQKYVAISDHLDHNGYKKVIEKGKNEYGEYSSLLDAYDAYVKLVNSEEKYKDYRNSL